MAEDSDLERTEPASPRRLEKAREEGDVPRSRELGTCVMLLAGCGGMWVLGGGLVRSMNHMLAAGLRFERDSAFDADVLMNGMAGYLGDVLVAFAPLAILMIVAAVASPLLMGGWLFTLNSLQPNFGRMNPISGVSNLFSLNSLVELGKAVAKALLVGIIAWLAVSRQLPAMFDLVTEPVNSGSEHLAHLLLVSSATIVGGLVIIAMIDAPYQLWHYADKLKMTREELRQESKESDGNPEIKAKIRQQQREMARRRMMAEIPKADVVVTNPTHFAVALKYDEGKSRAPRVIAKGADEVAAKIREIAAENKVPLLEAPPLARALYRHTDLGDEIPEALYTAVAEVLAYVFHLRVYREQGGTPPEAPKEVDVPPELDPLNSAAQAVSDPRTMQ